MNDGGVLYSAQDLGEAVEGRLFGPDTPRLPAPPMLAFHTVRVAEAPAGSCGYGLAEAEGVIGSLSALFDCHFRGDPVAPGASLLDALFQLTGFFAGHVGFRGRGRALGVRRVRFRAEVTPATRIISYRIDIRRVDTARQIVIADGVAQTDGEPGVTAEGILVQIR